MINQNEESAVHKKDLVDLQQYFQERDKKATQAILVCISYAVTTLHLNGWEHSKIIELVTDFIKEVGKILDDEKQS